MGVMTELHAGTARYAEALTSEATTLSLCRMLLDRKRDGTLKARIAVRGDLENTEPMDGHDFNFDAGTAATASVRLALLHKEQMCHSEHGRRSANGCSNFGQYD
jgi:hypothetical protein